MISMEVGPDEVKEWYNPSDFMIGVTINILGKKLFLYVIIV